MKNFILYILRAIMKFMYFFIKLFPIQKNKILMISRQSNKMSIDFDMLKDEILKDNYNANIKILFRKIPKNFIGKVKYCFYTIKCMYHIATSNVCIVEGYVIPVCILKHKKNLIIIQMWHALGSIKKFGKQILDKKEGNESTIVDIMQMHKNYNLVTCTSEATREFYAEAFEIEKEKVVVLGMPRVDYLLNKDNKINIKVEEMLKQYPHLKEKETILYAPTFRKYRKGKIDDIINNINHEKYNLIIHLHPLDKAKVDSKYTIAKEYNIFDLLKIADYIITDYSAVALEASVINKKVFFYVYDLKKYETDRGLNIKLQEEMSLTTFDNINPIIEMIEKKEYPYKQLKKFKEKYIETADTKNCERIVNYINKMLNK